MFAGKSRKVLVLWLGFCSKPQGMCEIQSHTKSYTNLHQECLYPYVPKKGINQLRLEQALLLSLLPSDEMIEMLLLAEKSVALWRTYIIWKLAARLWSS